MEKKSSGSWVVGKMDSRDGAQDEMWVKMNKIYENYEKKGGRVVDQGS